MHCPAFVLAAKQNQLICSLAEAVTCDYNAIEL